MSKLSENKESLDDFFETCQSEPVVHQKKCSNCKKYFGEALTHALKEHSDCSLCRGLKVVWSRCDNCLDAF